MYTLTEVQAEIALHGEQQERLGQIAKREGRLDEAKNHFNRAKVARTGRLLMSSVEASDPLFALEIQPLVEKAGHFDLVKWDLVEPDVV
jgi:hypothetical protein